MIVKTVLVIMAESALMDKTPTTVSVRLVILESTANMVSVDFR